jgi:hypothetical protein
MRILIVTALLALAACATGGGDPDVSSTAPSLFPVQRGTAPPPPLPTSMQAAPPEGRAAGGIDFGRWRALSAGADDIDGVYSASFQAQITAREQGRDAAAVRSDLEANGFACESGARLDCRIEIMEGQCASDWYVVVDNGAVHAGYEKMCLGSRS